MQVNKKPAHATVNYHIPVNYPAEAMQSSRNSSPVQFKSWKCYQTERTPPSRFQSHHLRFECWFNASGLHFIPSWEQMCHVLDNATVISPLFIIRNYKWRGWRRFKRPLSFLYLSFINSFPSSPSPSSSSPSLSLSLLVSFQFPFFFSFLFISPFFIFHFPQIRVASIELAYSETSNDTQEGRNDSRGSA